MNQHRGQQRFGLVGPLLGGAVGGALYKYGLQRYLPPAEAVTNA